METNSINTDRIIDFLEKKNISGDFDGVDLCLYTSLEEYNFIFSSKLKIAIYKNSLNNFDILLEYSSSDGIKDFEEFKGIINKHLKTKEDIYA